MKISESVLELARMENALADRDLLIQQLIRELEICQANGRPPGDLVLAGARSLARSVGVEVD